MPLVARYSIAKANGVRKQRQELLIRPLTHPLTTVAVAEVTAS